MHSLHVTLATTASSVSAASSSRGRSANAAATISACSLPLMPSSPERRPSLSYSSSENSVGRRATTSRSRTRSRSRRSARYCAPMTRTAPDTSTTLAADSRPFCATTSSSRPRDTPSAIHLPIETRANDTRKPRPPTAPNRCSACSSLACQHRRLRLAALWCGDNRRRRQVSAAETTVRHVRCLGTAPARQTDRTSKDSPLFFRIIEHSSPTLTCCCCLRYRWSPVFACYWRRVYSGTAGEGLSRERGGGCPAVQVS